MNIRKLDIELFSTQRLYLATLNDLKNFINQLATLRRQEVTLLAKVHRVLLAIYQTQARAASSGLLADLQEGPGGDWLDNAKVLSVGP
jgi:hypothetical protein